VPACYQYFEPVSYLLDVLFDVRIEAEQIEWATGGQMAVSARSIRRHPLVAYRVALALLNSTSYAPFWAMPSDARLLFQSSGRFAGKKWGSLELGHVFERMWVTIWRDAHAQG
jgi:hypothetical protein